MSYEIDFIQPGTGNGDAICCRYGSDYAGWTVHVVDAGFGDTGRYVMEHLDTFYGAPTTIDHVVLSHADNDHALGLIPILENRVVANLWMNRPWHFAAQTLHAFHGNYTVEGLRQEIRRRHPTLVRLEELAEAQGTQIHDAFAGTQIGQFTVLAPTVDRYVALVPDLDRTPTNYLLETPLRQVVADGLKELVQFFETWTNEQLQENPAPTSASNESCIVQLGRIEGETVLLTADAGPQALHEAANVAANLGLLWAPTLVQVPHHGSRRNVTPSVLNRWLGEPVPEGTVRGNAYVSVGAGKPQYPRKRVKNAFLRRGYGVHPTRGKWIRHRKDMPRRHNEIGITSEAFETSYEE